jgi:ATP-dependent Clp protease ATP-binding subunit ClpC
MIELTKRAKKIVNELSKEEAKKVNSETVNSEHVFLALLSEQDSVAIKIILNLSIDIDKMRDDIQKFAIANPNRDNNLQTIIDASMTEAKNLKHNYVGTEHILLAILKTESSLNSIFNSYKLTYKGVKNEINRLLNVTQPAQTESTKKTFEGKKEQKTKLFIEEYARDLTDMAKNSKLDPVIGRETEIMRVIQTLSRKTKNNPILVGEAGVGKTAIAEGLALEIIRGKVHSSLLNKRVMSLDIGLLLAGTRFRGDFEERLKRVIEDVQNNEIILFIDEIHTIIGAGSAEGAVDAANIMKPILARGEIQCIGATTHNEYRKYFEKDAALERRFQKVVVEEPSIENSIKILQGLKKTYEDFHKVEYTDEALKAAVELSSRYINDRFLPDKAIDLVDEAGAKAKIFFVQRPPQIEELELELKELANEKELMVKSQEYEKAAQVRDLYKEKKQKMNELILEWENSTQNNRHKIEKEIICNIVSQWTGVPVNKIDEKENNKLIDLEKILHQRVIGQNKAIESVSRAIIRSRTGFKSENRPSGSFVFMGPTGVGKTELAKTIGDFLFGKKNSFYHINMSEFMEPHSISKLIGSPPGYVGYEESGQLTDFVRKNPYSVVLLDEIEKAHPSVFNIFLQVMEEGTLTDSKGKKINFKDTILIMTSNIAADQIQKGGRMGFEINSKESESNKENMVKDELKKHFSPEFLNRIDDVIYFQPLKEEEIYQIIDLMINEFNKKLAIKKLNLNVTETAKRLLLKKGYDKNYGARPLRRVFQREIEDYISMQSLHIEFNDHLVIMDAEGEDNFSFKIEEKKDE